MNLEKFEQDARMLGFLDIQGNSALESSHPQTGSTFFSPKHSQSKYTSMLRVVLLLSHVLLRNPDTIHVGITRDILENHGATGSAIRLDKYLEDAFKPENLNIPGLPNDVQNWYVSANLLGRSTIAILHDTTVLTMFHILNTSKDKDEKRRAKLAFLWLRQHCLARWAWEGNASIIYEFDINISMEFEDIVKAACGT